MQLTKFYLSEADQRKVLFWSFVVLMALIVCVMPEMAFAQEDTGEAGYWGAGAEEIKDRSERSFQAWWDVASTWMLWLGLAILAATVIFFKGAGWWIALVVWAIAAWGDKIVAWAGAL